MTRRTVLITGASGFIGRAVSTELLGADGVALHTVSRGDLDLGSPDAEHRHHRCDLFDEGGTKTLLEAVRPDVLIHCAWYAEHGKFWNAEENLDWVGATINLVRNFHVVGGKRFVGIGTCAEYDWTQTADLHETDSLLEPSTLYGMAKDATRRVVESFAEGVGMSWAWARLFMMYGPGESATRLFPSIALPLLSGENAQCSAGDQLRDFMHVEDLARALVCVALSDFVGPINVASGEATAVGDFASEVACATDSVGRLERGALPMREGDPPRIIADTTRLRSLGFEPQFDLKSGVARAVEQLRRNENAQSDPE